MGALGIVALIGCAVWLIVYAELPDCADYYYDSSYSESYCDTYQESLSSVIWVTLACAASVGVGGVLLIGSVRSARWSAPRRLFAFPIGLGLALIVPVRALAGFDTTAAVSTSAGVTASLVLGLTLLVRFILISRRLRDRPS